jgi:hypothetical protein
MSAYFAAHPDHEILFAFGCFALTVYLFRYVGPWHRRWRRLVIA